MTDLGTTESSSRSTHTEAISKVASRPHSVTRSSREQIFARHGSRALQHSPDSSARTLRPHRGTPYVNPSSHPHCHWRSKPRFGRSVGPTIEVHARESRRRLHRARRSTRHCRRTHARLQGRSLCAASGRIIAMEGAASGGKLGGRARWRSLRRHVPATHRRRGKGR
jgi:hypothetical protein